MGLRRIQPKVWQPTARSNRWLKRSYRLRAFRRRIPRNQFRTNPVTENDPGVVRILLKGRQRLIQFFGALASTEKGAIHATI